MSEIFPNKNLGSYSKPYHEISGHQDKNPKEKKILRPSKEKKIF